MESNGNDDDGESYYHQQPDLIQENGQINRHRSVKNSIIETDAISTSSEYRNDPSEIQQEIEKSEKPNIIEYEFSNQILQDSTTTLANLDDKLRQFGKNYERENHYFYKVLKITFRRYKSILHLVKLENQLGNDDEIIIEKDEYSFLKNQQNIIQHMDNFIDHLKIDSNKVLEESVIILKKIQYLIPIYFRSVKEKGIATAITIFAVKKLKCFKSMRSIYTVAKKQQKISAKLISKCLNILKQILPKDDFKGAQYEDFMKRATAQLQLSKETQSNAKMAYHYLKRQVLFGSHQLRTMVAVSILLAQGLREDQKSNTIEEIAEATSTSVLPVQIMFKRVMKYSTKQIKAY